MTLTDFLLARIAEDESDAKFRAVLPAQTWRARRLMAEVEAKRRIVQREADSRTKITFRRRMVLQDLASVYADHPDYDESWNPES